MLTPRCTKREKRLIRRGLAVTSIVVLTSLISTSAKAQASGNGREFSLTSFDARCGSGGDCRNAFQRAFQAIGAAHGGTLVIPAGTFLINFPELPNNQKVAAPLKGSSLMIVPPNTSISGHRGADGSPDTVIEWNENCVPLFVFPNASGSSVRDIHFHFAGTSPSNFPYGDVALLRALGFQPTYPHTNQMAGGSYEIFSVLYLVGSEHCLFDNLVFDSKTKDNNHVYGFAINTKGKGIYVSGGGGGLTDLSEGNTYNNLKIFDDVMGMMFSGQKDLNVSNISADRRGSTMEIAPGHVIYVSAMLKNNPGGKVDLILNKNITIKNVTEGPDTYSNIHAGGTLAIKYTDGGTIENITSRHPVGLLQTLTSVQNVVFQDMKWESDYHLCDNSPQDICQVPVINSTFHEPGQPELKNLKFERISLKSTVEPITVTLMGTHVVVDNLEIQTPGTYKKGQANASGVLSVKQATDVTVTNYRYIPVINHYDSSQHFNAPFACWNPCQDVKGEVVTKWPKNIPTPPATAQVVKPVFQGQDENPGKHIAVTSKVEPSDH